MINVLELFSGTKSVGKVCDSLGWNSVSVDLLLPADHQVDIMNFDYKQYPKDYFDIVWASPPCTEYSQAKSTGIRDIEGSNKLVLKTLEIINYFDCNYWFMENPKTGRLKDREVVKGLPFYDIDYCMYSDWGYKKQTRIWTNKKDWNNLICDGKGTCGNMIDNKHKRSVDGGKKGVGKNHRTDDILDRYRIPEDLIYSLFLD